MRKRQIYIIACKVLRKIHLNHLSYRITHFLVNHSSVDVSNLAQCEETLAKVYPDQGKSCVRNNPPSVSKSYDLQIVIPAYNVEKYIGDCLESVFSQQTRYSYLVVVVNDGSTDSTAEVLTKYQDYKNIRIIHQANRGLSGARNKALERIEAEYVTFLDSDDQLMPLAIENMMNAAISGNYDMVAGGYETFSRDLVLSSHILQSSHNYLSIPGFACVKIYRSSLFADIHFPEHYLFEDTLVSFVLYQKCCSIVSIPDIVYRYRVNNQGITATSKANPKSLDSFWITKRLLEDRTILGIEEEPTVFAIILLRQIYINFSRIYTLGNKEVDKAVFVLSVKMIEDQFEDRPSGLGKYEDLYQALISHNYSAYRWFCLLH